ncbi:hypothetical protein EDC04DRAFT_2568682, partial [Pisolithus marmoratus]
YQEEYLFEELRLESHGEGTRWCICTKASNEAPSKQLFCCEDCYGMELLCEACCLTIHKHLPLHKIQVSSSCSLYWNGMFFDQVTLKQLGLVIQVSHKDMLCYCPEHGHTDFIIINVNGIHPVNINFCGCEQHVSHHQQLL